MDRRLVASELLKMAKELLARKEVLDVARIQQFRKEFLMIMKNIDRVDSYSKAIELNKGMSKWREQFDEYLYKHLLKTLERIYYNKDITEQEWKWWDESIRKKTWDFVIELSIPISMADDYWSEEARFKQYGEKLKKWQSRVTRTARVAWDVLSEFVEWYESKLSKKIEVDIPEIEQIEMEGFTVILKGHDTARDADKKIAIFKEGLKRYKQGMSVIPWLAKYKLPILLDFYLQLDDGGVYLHDKIMVSAAVIQSPERIEYVIAHEMGHHLWHVLGSDIVNYWHKVMEGGKVLLDLSEVVKKWGDEEYTFENEKMIEQDPSLYRQLDGLRHSIGLDKELKEAMTIKDIREYLEKGGDKTVSVYLKPISGYAHKNSTEAFCEAVGSVVTYGVNSVPEEVLGLMKEIGLVR